MEQEGRERIDFFNTDDIINSVYWSDSLLIPS